MYAMPLKNCNDCLKNNPPLVIFFICLLIITATTTFFTFYVKNSEKIINGDARQNWVSLTRHLNQLDLCIPDSTDNLTETQDYDTSFATLVNANLSQFANLTQIRAYYSLEGWHPFCGGTADSLTVDFFLAPDSSDSGNGTICGIIRGPRGLLPEFSQRSCGFYDDVDDNGTLTIQSRPELCASSNNATKTKFLFDENEEFVTYLSQADKSAMYLHLLWSSSVLLFFILIMLIYGMFYQREYISKAYILYLVVSVRRIACS